MNRQKQLEIRNEQILKADVTKKPFNLNLIKNQANFSATSQSPNSNSDRRRRGDGEPRPKKKAGDGMQVFTHFLLGKTEMDESEQKELQRKQTEQRLQDMLRKREQDEKQGIEVTDAQNDTIRKLTIKLNSSNFIPGGNAAQIGKKDREVDPEDNEHYSPSGLTPIMTESEEDDDIFEESSSEEDMEAKEKYKNAAYWTLPENVRQAVDAARRKSKHSDFYNRLKSLNDKIGVYKKIFYGKTPRYERTFLARKRKRLEELMRREQQDLENFITQEAKRQEEKRMNRHKAHGLKPVTKLISNVSANVSPKSEEDQNNTKSKGVALNLNPAGKARQNLRLARRFESAYELQQGTMKRSKQLALDYAHDNKDLGHDQQIKNLKDPNYKMPRDQEAAAKQVRKLGSLQSIPGKRQKSQSTSSPDDTLPADSRGQALEAVTEERFSLEKLRERDQDTPAVADDGVAEPPKHVSIVESEQDQEEDQEEDPEESFGQRVDESNLHDLDSIDEDILKDIDEYRKEQRLREELKMKIERQAEDGELCASPSSPNIVRHKEAFRKEISQPRSSIMSQDSPRRKFDSKRSSGVKHLSTLHVSHSQHRALPKAPPSKTSKGHEKKHRKKNKEKKMMRERIAGILVDIDKSILEINRHHGDGNALLDRLGAKQRKQDNKKKKSKKQQSIGKILLQNQASTGASIVNTSPMGHNQYSKASQLQLSEIQAVQEIDEAHQGSDYKNSHGPSTFKKKLAEYQQTSRPRENPTTMGAEIKQREVGNLSFLSADRDLNNLISKKPKRTNGARFTDLIINVNPTDLQKTNTTDRRASQKKKKQPKQSSNSGKQSNKDIMATVHSSQVGSLHSSYGIENGQPAQSYKVPPIVSTNARKVNPVQQSKKDGSSGANTRHSGPIDAKRDKQSEFMQLYRFDGSTGGNHGIQTGSQLLQDNQQNAYPDYDNEGPGTQSSVIERGQQQPQPANALPQMSKKFLENFNDSLTEDEDDPNMHSPEPAQPYDSRDSRKDLTQASGSSQLKMQKKQNGKRATKKVSNGMKNPDQYKTRLMVDFIDQFGKAKGNHLNHGSVLTSQLNAIVRDAGKSTIAKPSTKLHGFEKNRHTIQGFKSSERVPDLSMSAKVKSGRDVTMLKTEKQRIIDSYTRQEPQYNMSQGFSNSSHHGSFAHHHHHKRAKRNLKPVLKTEAVSERRREELDSSLPNVNQSNMTQQQFSPTNGPFSPQKRNGKFDEPLQSKNAFEKQRKTQNTSGMNYGIYNGGPVNEHSPNSSNRYNQQQNFQVLYQNSSKNIHQELKKQKLRLPILGSVGAHTAGKSFI